MQKLSSDLDKAYLLLKTSSKNYSSQINALEKDNVTIEKEKLRLENEKLELENEKKKFCQQIEKLSSNYVS